MSNQVIDASAILSWLQNRIAQELDCTVDEVDFDQHNLKFHTISQSHVEPSDPLP